MATQAPAELLAPWLACAADWQHNKPTMLYPVAGSAAHGSHEDVVAVQRRLPLAGFDRIIRHTGAVLWLIPFLLRAAATYYTTSEAAPRRAQHFYRAFLLYVVLSVLRTAVYILQSRGIVLVTIAAHAAHKQSRVTAAISMPLCTCHHYRQPTVALSSVGLLQLTQLPGEFLTSHPFDPLYNLHCFGTTEGIFHEVCKQSCASPASCSCMSEYRCMLPPFSSCLKGLLR